MSLNINTQAQSHRHNLILTDILRYIGEFLRACEKFLAPLMDVVIRLFLAQIFLSSAMLKLSNWDIALYLSAHEYPVSWINSVLAAYLGVSIELVGGVLLLLGLMTRFAALGLLVLSIIIQLSYQALNTQIFWIILLTWYVIMGAGPISFDHLFRGIKDSALFLTKPLGQLFDFLTNDVGSIYLLIMRLWIASVLYIAGHSAMDSLPLTQFLSEHLAFLHYQFEASVLRMPEAHFFLSFSSGVCALFIALGLGTRIIALMTLVAISIIMWQVTATPLQHMEYVFWILLLSLLFFYGPGSISLDQPLRKWLVNHFPQIDGRIKQIDDALPHVVIVGAGFGGIAAARMLRTTACRITMIDIHNYHLFQPLLYQVATAGLSPADIAVPIRSLFRDQNNIRIVLGEVISVDKQNSEVILKEGQHFHFDYLILASGARPSYFGKDEWIPFAPGLKKIEDAIAIRGKLLKAFELAENSTDPQMQRDLLTFVIVGGGPTGVELAGSLAELAHQGMKNEFRNIDPAMAKIYLVEAAPRLLSVMPEPLSQYTKNVLEKLGIEVIVGGHVEDINASGVIINGKKIMAANVFWAAGVQASKAAEWVTGAADRTGRLIVNQDLSVPGTDNIFAVGDTVLAEVWNGKPMPGLAPAAKQSGAYVARLIRARIEGRKFQKPFKYRHYGSLATIGRRAAVADFDKFQMHGAMAWWFWGGVHLFYLNNMRNRLVVMIQWFWAYLTFKNTTRLITDNK